MKGARINFGVPNSEYVLLANDNGEAVSLKNQDTNTEYIGGGGGDFSIANVTFGKNEDVDSMDMAPILLEDQLTILPFAEAAGEQQVPLYKGMTTFYIFADCDIQVTGDITVDEYQCVTISGDGSIYLDTK